MIFDFFCFVLFFFLNLGKTHTMLGNPSEPGIIPLAIRQIFNEIRCRKERSFLLK